MTGWHEHPGMGGGWMVLVMLLLLLVVTGALVVGWLALRGPHPRAAGPGIAGLPRPVGGRPGSARQILDERLARGDLSPEDYQRRRRLLDDLGDGDSRSE